MKHRAAFLLALTLVSGCRSAGNSSVATPARPAAATATATTALPDSIRWVRGSAEYVAALEQVYRQAGSRVESEGPTHAAGTWAVVLDTDETILNNAEYQEERVRAGLGYTDQSWDAWVKRREATPLPGAGDFLSRVHTLGGRIAIVTNRLESQCADTKAVFATYSLVFDVMLCRPDGQPSDKNPRFRAVESGRAFEASAPVTVVAYLGDNILDFPALAQSIKASGPFAFSEFGVRFFVVPNPMYGSWQ